MEHSSSAAPLDIPDDPIHEENNHNNAHPHKSTSKKPINPLRLKTPSTTANTPLRSHRLHRRHHHRRHHNHHSSHKSSKNSPDNPSPFTQSMDMDSETAFRESLFDALADDEGAAFWEGVYGQPVHIYARPTHTPSSSTAAGAGPDTGIGTSTGTGEPLETMTDDEYAAYVRSKMYERSHEYIFAERAKRAEQRRREREQERERERDECYRRRRDHHHYHHRYESPTSTNFSPKHTTHLTQEQWRTLWHRYTTSWSSSTTPSTSAPSSNPNPTSSLNSNQKIPAWPTPTLSPPPPPSFPQFESQIKKFYTSILPLVSTSSPDSSLSQNEQEILKKERVRWHPDKIAQRLFLGAASTTSPPTSGKNPHTTTTTTTGTNINSETELETKNLLKTVTAVFQVIDRLYTERKPPPPPAIVPVPGTSAGGG